MTTKTTAPMSDTDRVQIWKYFEHYTACEVGGKIELTITETLDFDAMTLTTEIVGWREGERVDTKDLATSLHARDKWENTTQSLASEVTSVRAAAYRRRSGYVRVG